MGDNGNNIKGLIDVTMEKVRALVDADTIIGDPIIVGAVTIIPVSKVSFGLATGGSDLPSKQEGQQCFAGGGGAGVSVTPIAFISIKDGDVKLMQIYKDSSAAEKAVSLVPDLFDKISSLFSKKKNDTVGG